LEVHIHHLAILVYRSPQIVLLAVYFDEYLIDVGGVAIASVL
jgi:hypothetical protein